VPNVLGQPLDTAKATLQGARLAVSVASVASSEPKGTVVSQDPGAGARVAPETTVRIGISKGGEATSEVPNVVGLDEASATAALVKAGFRVSVQRQTTSDAAQDGIVLSQYPSPGTRLAAGEKVAVTVGRYTSSP
jgi:beta-lactam-binding protein with PASTA domain